MRLVKITISILFVFIFAAFVCRAQADEPFALTAEKLTDGKTIELVRAGWRYRAGDSLDWAAKDFDDGDWARVYSNWRTEEDFKSIEWNGRAWFRLRMQVDDELANQPLALRVRQLGASEIYIDGKLLHRFGVIEADSDEEFNPQGLFVPVVFTEGGAHTIAVRYSYSAAGDAKRGLGRWLVRGRYAPGFLLTFAQGNDAAFNLEQSLNERRVDYVFIGIFLASALVHLLLFAFYRRAAGNLFYTLFALGVGATIWTDNASSFGHYSAVVALLARSAQENVQILAVVALLGFLYVEFVGRLSRFFWLLLAVGVAGIILKVAQILPGTFFTPIMLMLALADGLRIMWRALRERRAGARVIAAGIGVFFVCVWINISVGNRFLEVPEWLSKTNRFITILVVPFVVSFYLARNFARANRNLETQLAQIKELSERELEHERTEADLRLAHEREKSENERRAKELEEAKQLQLSMLPKKLPQISNLEIAAYMKPATEVGGDYYDFHVGNDGTLTVAVGDATGHGLKAGSVVTATKSLFNAFANEDDITDIFRQSSAALKRMNLRGLFMAMTILKIKDDNLQISSAGMPATLLFRRATKRVEEIFIKAMPLGSVAKFPYERRDVSLSSGDLIVVMSDGFPERFNAENEMLGFDEAAKVLSEIADGTPQEIVNRFVEAGEIWAGNRPQDDDVTFVVLKVNNDNGAIS